MRTVLKLGGSVITDKERPETVDEEALAAASAAIGEAIAASDRDLILVHGGGSFGHYHADRHGVSASVGTQDAAAVREIHQAMTTLNASVLAALADADVPAVPVRPLSGCARDATGDLSYALSPVETLLGEGFLPVLHGDVVAHTGAGATILSGDELVVRLADGLDADRVGLCAGVPGVLDREGDVIDRIDAYDDVAATLGTSEDTDVTGGMAGKVEALLGLAAPTSVFGLRELPGFLAGERPGTTVGHES